MERRRVLLLSLLESSCDVRAAINDLERCRKTFSVSAGTKCWTDVAWKQLIRRLDTWEQKTTSWVNGRGKKHKTNSRRLQCSIEEIPRHLCTVSLQTSYSSLECNFRSTILFRLLISTEISLVDMILTKIVLTFGLLAVAGATEVDFMPNDGGELHLFFYSFLFICRHPWGSH